MPPGALGRPARICQTESSLGCIGDGAAARVADVRGTLFISAAPQSRLPCYRHAVKHPFTITYSALSLLSIPYEYAQKPKPTGLNGAQHETNVTASVRHCRFIHCRTYLRAAKVPGLELAA
jgi:hypothetical protein